MLVGVTVLSPRLLNPSRSKLVFIERSNMAKINAREKERTRVFEWSSHRRCGEGG
jgi:hypothetical protein